jgi:hypothetical protein
LVSFCCRRLCTPPLVAIKHITQRSCCRGSLHGIVALRSKEPVQTICFLTAAFFICPTRVECILAAALHALSQMLTCDIYIYHRLYITFVSATTSSLYKWSPTFNVPLGIIIQVTLEEISGNNNCHIVRREHRWSGWSGHRMWPSEARRQGQYCPRSVSNPKITSTTIVGSGRRCRWRPFSIYSAPLRNCSAACTLRLLKCSLASMVSQICQAGGALAHGVWGGRGRSCLRHRPSPLRGPGTCERVSANKLI